MPLRTKETTQVEFKEIKTSGVFIAQIEASQRDSMNILKQKGFRALAYQSALVKIDQNPDLKEQLKGKWFYLQGEGFEGSGYHTFDEEGKLKKGKGDVEKTVYTWNGSQPLSLVVRGDVGAATDDGRFGLVAYCRPDVVAPVVVGVRDGHEVARPELETKTITITTELVSQFRSVATQIDSATQVKVLNPEINEVVKKVLRAME